MKKINLTGRKFGRLTVIVEVGRNIHKKVLWKCKCDCGNHVVVNASRLRTGATKSCGCLRRELKTKHGLSYRAKRLHRIWIGMRRRCINPKSDSYYRYGGRGISICREWDDYEAFYNWAIENGYEDNLTIERINNNGDYCPKNCTWIPQSRQPRNSHVAKLITYKGQSKTYGEWGKIYGLHGATIRGRLKLGWSTERALTTPVNK